MSPGGQPGRGGAQGTAGSYPQDVCYERPSEVGAGTGWHSLGHFPPLLRCPRRRWRVYGNQRGAPTDGERRVSLPRLQRSCSMPAQRSQRPTVLVQTCPGLAEPRELRPGGQCVVADSSACRTSSTWEGLMQSFQVRPRDFLTATDGSRFRAPKELGSGSRKGNSIAEGEGEPFSPQISILTLRRARVRKTRRAAACRQAQSRLGVLTCEKK